MEKSERNRERRKQNRLDKLGTNQPRCAICGETNPIPLERHHVAGRKFSEATVILCANHHRIITDFQKDRPSPIGGRPSLIECMVNFLFGLADMFEVLVSTCRAFASQLMTEARTAGGASVDSMQ